MDIKKIKQGEVSTLDYPFILCTSKDGEEQVSIPVDSFYEFSDGGCQVTCLAGDYEDVPEKFEGGTFELVIDGRSDFTQIEPVMAGAGRVLFQG